MFWDGEDVAGAGLRAQVRSSAWEVLVWDSYLKPTEMLNGQLSINQPGFLQGIGVRNKSRGITNGWLLSLGSLITTMRTPGNVMLEKGRGPGMGPSRRKEEEEPAKRSRMAGHWGGRRAGRKGLSQRSREKGSQEKAVKCCVGQRCWNEYCGKPLALCWLWQHDDHRWPWELFL